MRCSWFSAVQTPSRQDLMKRECCKTDTLVCVCVWCAWEYTGQYIWAATFLYLLITIIVMVVNSVPFVGFGFLDNFLMIIAVSIFKSEWQKNWRKQTQWYNAHTFYSTSKRDCELLLQVFYVLLVALLISLKLQSHLLRIDSVRDHYLYAAFVCLNTLHLWS